MSVIAPPRFVKRGQVFVCDFEACNTSTTSMICYMDENIGHPVCGFTANIKPEIGKCRPVVIVYAHKRTRLALVLPFTTQKPKREIANTLPVPVGVMPGVLARKECWALCDMMQVVNLDRLQPVYFNNITAAHTSFNESRLPMPYFDKILEIIHKVVGKK
ncbi:MAG: type II toxin-antitoxin system PemK/MazF family toxin [Rickettsiales bacterium]|jgi:uncharacterized protein YifN (PemK superfamily)|nr:type II toxin-antitoxin system PemK/MazF family toxin [Rickettsiales bacterium]